MAAMVAAKAKGEAVAEKGVEWKVAVVRKADGGEGGSRRKARRGWKEKTAWERVD